jgi:hypothetical protein
MICLTPEKGPKARTYQTIAGPGYSLEPSTIYTYIRFDYLTAMSYDPACGR